MSLSARFAASAARFPEAPALVIRDAKYTYRQLDETARIWASHVVSRIGGFPTRVGVFGSRSFISYTGVIAAVYCGATFVPLNPRFPVERTRRMIESADLDFIIADSLASPQLPDVIAGLKKSPLHADAKDLEAVSEAPLSVPARPQDTSHAYLLFTSGSTGQPKGVPITYDNLLAYLDWGQARYGFTSADRFSQTFDQTFDLSIHDQFLCWGSGASLHVLSPPELLAPARFIREHQLTTWFSVPSVVAQMRRRKTLIPGAFPSLRWSLFCGEPLPAASAQQWQDAASNSTVENLYGPTELTIACMVHRWDSATSPALCRDGLVSIGAPFPSLKAIVREGELCIAGPQTSPGYWRDADRTSSAFLNLPEGRFYRTGDRVAELPGGEYSYLGRVDHQVKVLGFRVELGEIESLLRESPGVVSAVALGWPVVDGSAQGIIAFVQGADIDTNQVMKRAQERLSAYMVPSAIYVLDEMPLNANGKIDRAALAARLS